MFTAMAKKWVSSLLMAAAALAPSASAFVTLSQKRTIRQRAAPIAFTNLPSSKCNSKILPGPRQNHELTISSVSLSMTGPSPTGSGGGGSGLDMDPGLKLLICILIDFVGVASFAAPGVGEAADVGWAPISAFLINYLFGNGIITALALFEELSPGFDIIPTATIAWFIENAGRESATSSEQPIPPPPVSEEPPVRPPPTKKPDVSNVIDAEVLD